MPAPKGKKRDTTHAPREKKLRTTKGRAAKRPRRVVLLDAHAIIHRAYHALPAFTTPSGEPAGALYGLAAMLLSLIEELKPDYLIAAYDLPEKTFRHEAYDAYKAGRKETEEALAAQLARSRALFEAFGIPVCAHPGFEADDVLGTLAASLKRRRNMEVIIASGDMDTLQLVDGRKVMVYTLRKGMRDTVLYDEAAVCARFGFPPALLPDYKGLRGDPSDNIIGVPGIGEKTAAALVQAFGTLEKMYAVLRRKGGEEAFLRKGFKPRVVRLLREHEEEARFSKELAAIRTRVPLACPLPKHPWHKALDRSAARALLREWGFRSLVARFDARFPAEEGTARDTAAPGGVSAPPREEAADPVMLEEAKVALWLLDSARTHPSLEDILSHTGAKDLAAAHRALMEELSREGLWDVFATMEKPLIPILRRMEARGVLLDRAYLAEVSRAYRKELEALERTIHTMAGVAFNINSPRQLGEVLFDTLALSPKGVKKTATGQRSTQESELEKLRAAHPVVPLILEYRELQKLLSTYLEPLPSMADSAGRLHTRFSQTGTATGRLSSQHPNLQNLPIKTARGRAIRRAIIAPKGFSLMSFDYSQIELRIAALLSGDEALCAAFVRGEDVHAAVAAAMFGVAEDAVTPEMRRRAKVINFGILYGMGVNALKENLGVARDEAQAYLHAYFTRFAGLARFLERTKKEAAARGYTTTLFGRRRRFPGITSPLPQVRAAAERMALNAPIQGTQADIIKLAMVAIDALIKKKGWGEKVYPVLQIHDELLFEVRREVRDAAARAIKEVMEHVVPEEQRRGVPLLVEVREGPTWADMAQWRARA